MQQAVASTPSPGSPLPHAMGGESRLMKAALTYAKRGWQVFPLHTPRVGGGCSCRRDECLNVGKHPRTLNGHKDATLDEATIRRWWTSWPEANIGIACGPSDLAVIDVDPRHGGDEAFRDLVQRYGEGLMETVVTVTGGGGAHYYYEVPPGQRITNSAGSLGPGVDVRGDGGYVVAPPSLHESGKEYAWERSAAQYALAPFPDIMIARPVRSAAPMVGDMIPSGERDNTLTSLAGTMRRRGMGEASILAALREENKRCVPPLPDGDLGRIARSVAHYEPGRDIPVQVAGLTNYQHLRKLTTKPPSYQLEVSGMDVRLSLNEILSHRDLTKAIYSQTDVLVPAMKEIEWRATLASLTETIETLPAPADASEEGLVWGVIRKYLMEGTEDIDDAMERGQPYHDDERVYFNGNAIRVLIQQQGFRVEQREVWEVLRGRGAKETTKSTQKNPKQRFWSLPQEALHNDGE